MAMQVSLPKKMDVLLIQMMKMPQAAHPITLPLDQYHAMVNKDDHNQSCRYGTCCKNLFNIELFASVCILVSEMLIFRVSLAWSMV